ncbi:hypothetical protein IIV22A_030L [Invertebrate iridescent virus 22]|uniref:Uncharacterized protein n=1 Tax=Invertebrate iridescent virus 22 TaxID=345198 RepID=W8W2P0_9VIRU|nr:hypothetical protein IIV22A_030L [Invertebrate iridescent virus 22]CCV01874.1 hypothetical protein IIV22A_030L [Invertebrate iridescent virus 22]
MALINDFLKSLAMPVSDLAKWLEEEHQVAVAETIEKWNQLTGMLITIDEDSVNCASVEDQTININKKVTPKTNGVVGKLDPKLCQHIFIAGGRKGQQCTTKPKGGKSDRCSAHKLKVKKSESDSDAPKKQPTKKTVKAKKNVKTDSETDSSKKKIKRKSIQKKSADSDSEEEEEYISTVVPDTKPQKKVPQSDSDSDSEEETPKKKSPQKKVPQSDSDSDSEEETPKKKSPQKKVPQSDSDSD